jgi:cell division septal protein FtsQ
MSREGRRRVKVRVLRWAAAAAVLGLLAWGILATAEALRTGSGAAKAAQVSAAPIRETRLSTDGVLDRAWLERALAIPRGATLMDLDLARLRARLLAGGQVRSASLVRRFPATLAVALSERTPVARLREGEGGPGLLVARDGVAYQGQGYDPALVQSLPWLDGAKVQRSPGALPQVAGMEIVANLLSRAQLEAEPIYRTWETVSLSRLQTDGEIEIRSRDGLAVTFGTQDDFLTQLGRLDHILDTAAARPGVRLKAINLAIPGQAPVSVVQAPAAGDEAPQAAAGPAAPARPAAPVYQIHLN